MRSASRRRHLCAATFAASATVSVGRASVCERAAVSCEYCREDCRFGLAHELERTNERVVAGVREPAHERGYKHERRLQRHVERECGVVIRGPERSVGREERSLGFKLYKE